MGPRILIVRLSAIGDVIHGVPALCALRAAKPDAFLAWVVEGGAGDLLEGHPALDELIRVPRRFWKSPGEVFRLRRRLRELRFDAAIDLQCLTKSAVTAWLSGAPRRIGKAGDDGRELSRWFHNELTQPGGTHVIEHYLGMLRPLGIEFSPVGGLSEADDGTSGGAKKGREIGVGDASHRISAVRFDLPEFAIDAHAVETFLQARGLWDQPFAVLNPGAGWPSKIWPAVRYAGLARYLGQAHGVPSVAVWGTPQELQFAKQIVETGARHVHLAPPTTMRQLGALCRRAALFVGSDTGPMHLAAAVGTPTISLHGTSRAEWCGAYGAQNIRLQARYQAGSSLERRKADDSAMREITVKMVAAACDQLLLQPVTRQVG